MSGDRRFHTSLVLIRMVTSDSLLYFDHRPIYKPGTDTHTHTYTYKTETSHNNNKVKERKKKRKKDRKRKEKRRERKQKGVKKKVLKKIGRQAKSK